MDNMTHMESLCWDNYIYSVNPVDNMAVFDLDRKDIHIVEIFVVK
jgi:hypothetical protein